MLVIDEQSDAYYLLTRLDVCPIRCDLAACIRSGENISFGEVCQRPQTIARENARCIRAQAKHGKADELN